MRKLLDLFSEELGGGGTANATASGELAAVLIADARVTVSGHSRVLYRFHQRYPVGWTFATNDAAFRCAA